MGDEEFADEEGGAELYENEEGIDDPDGMYKLDNITAETFQKISNIERENALMKLKIEQEKLKLDLQKQEAEKKKLAASVPVHAPVPGSGIPTNKSNATKSPLPAVACNFSPPFSPFAVHQRQNLPIILGILLPISSTFLANK